MPHPCFPFLFTPIAFYCKHQGVSASELSLVPETWRCRTGWMYWWVKHLWEHLSTGEEMVRSWWTDKLPFVGWDNTEALYSLPEGLQQDKAPVVHSSNLLIIILCNSYLPFLVSFPCSLLGTTPPKMVCTQPVVLGSAYGEMHCKTMTNIYIPLTSCHTLY